MLKILVCDDEKKYRDITLLYLQRYMEEKKVSFSVSECTSGEELMEMYPTTLADIILLDMMMDEANGIEVAKTIRKYSEDACIIYISSYPQYALQSFEVKPFGFLTKPLAYATFSYELELAVKHAERSACHYLTVKDNDDGTIRQISTKALRYAESNDHLTTLYLENGTVVTRRKVDELEEELKVFGFLRPHKSFLVNHRYILKIDKDIQLLDGTLIPVSRAKRKEFITSISTYIGTAP